MTVTDNAWIFSAVGNEASYNKSIVTVCVVIWLRHIIIWCFRKPQNNLGSIDQSALELLCSNLGGAIF